VCQVYERQKKGGRTLHHSLLLNLWERGFAALSKIYLDFHALQLLGLCSGDCCYTL